MKFICVAKIQMKFIYMLPKYRWSLYMCCQNTDEVYICVASKYRWILYMCWLNIDEVYMWSLKIKKYEKI